jgi:hypothetical protein
MTHLSPEELLDIAEGARPEHAHLSSCATCRDEVIEMRALMGAVAAADMPEPSPLFWDHLSSRVIDAVTMEAPPAPTRDDRWGWVFNVWSWRLAAPLTAFAAAALVVAVFVASHRSPALPVPSQQAATAAPAPEVAALPAVDAGNTNDSPFDSASDPSFAFVADLTTGMDMDTALDAGLVSDGSAEHAITHLSEGELRELAKLLTEEIARAQAS